MAKWVKIAVGAALIAGTLLSGGALAPALASFLISAGTGLVLSGIGSLLSKGPLQGISTATRNPIAPWNVLYGRGKLGGTIVYINQWGSNNAWIDLVIVLNCHKSESVDALQFDGQRVALDSHGCSFSPTQISRSISSIVRANDVVTVILSSAITTLRTGDSVRVRDVSGDLTLNGQFPIQIVSSTTFTYICGGAAASVSSSGTVDTLFPDFGSKVYMEALLGAHSATFTGMLSGTPNDGNTGDLVGPSPNPWTSAHQLLGKTSVFLRLHYDDKYFSNGLPAISFLVSGKNDVADPRTSPITYGYTENPALCIADYLSNTAFGFKANYGTEIPVPQLNAAANVCDESVMLAAGGVEPRYTCNGGFPITMKRGEVLQNLLTACGGRLTYTGGQFLIQPAHWPGVSLALTGVGTWNGGPQGWTPRVAAHNLDGIATYDCLAMSIGAFTGTATWPGTCNVINWAALVALKWAGGAPPAFVQGAGNASAYVGGGFNTWTIAFPANNTAGNCLVVDVAFNTGYPLSGASVTDSQGNTYKPVYGAHTLGSASFVICFVAPNCAGGANTLTITQTGDSGFEFQGIAVAIHEYSGLSASLPTGTPPINYGSYTDATGVADAATGSSGPAANTQTETVTTSSANDVLHFIAASLSYCAGVTLTGGAPPPVGLLAVAAGPFRWRSKVSSRDLYNGVKGTYISQFNNWQSSDIPPYAQDPIHGYSSDANLTADGGDRRWFDVQLPFTISPATAQRLCKIELLRRRQQGTGTFALTMAGYQITALDIVALTVSYLSWTSKTVEVLAHRFTLDRQHADSGEVTLLGTEIDVQETDASVYAWTTGEELTARGYQQGTLPSNVGTLDDMWTVNGT